MLRLQIYCYVSSDYSGRDIGENLDYQVRYFKRSNDRFAVIFGWNLIFSLSVEGTLVSTVLLPFRSVGKFPSFNFPLSNQLHKMNA